MIFFLISPQCTAQGEHKIIEMNAVEQLNAKEKKKKQKGLMGNVL